jgi:2-oxoglutarate ferredoxin oxidoreductase subunit alpha
VHGADIGIIAFGTTDACVVESRDQLHAQGVETSYLRLRALPPGEVTRQFMTAHDRIYVVENNTDGQVAKLLCTEFPDLAPRIISVAYSDGLPLTPRWMTAAILEQER